MRGEVHNGVHGVAVEDGRQGVSITDVQLVDGTDEAAGDPFDAGEDLWSAVGVVVDHDHLVAVIEEFHAGMTADEAGPAGDQYGELHFPRLVCLPWQGTFAA